MRTVVIRRPHLLTDRCYGHAQYLYPGTGYRSGVLLVGHSKWHRILYMFDEFVFDTYPAGAYPARARGSWVMACGYR